MKKLLLLSIIAFGGCAINVRHSPTGPNAYLVTADGENHHSHADLTHAAHERAQQLCPMGYHIQALDSGSQVQGHANQNGAFVGTSGSVSQYIVCNTPEPVGGFGYGEQR